ncbi:hypothetical protein [Erwinia oleae]|uniref:hypothetical protein n=1 Tax=Erwinia oleae TaxID=796334 RepID=UPI001269B47F|nr:hypothetical protein [Erwinia oleae]
MEYLVWKIERKRWPEINYYDVPYRIVDFLFDYIGMSELSVSAKLLFIEFCLYNDNPVAHFFYFSEEHKAEILHQDQSGASYSFFKKIVWNAKGGFSDSVETKAKRRREQLIDSFSACYCNEEFSKAREWLVFTLNYDFTSSAGVFFFYSLYNLDPLMLRLKLESIFNDVGLPVFLSSTGEKRTLLPERFNTSCFSHLHISGLLIKAFTDAEEECPMLRYDLCPGSRENHCWCQKDFLQILSLKEPCPMTQLLDKLGLGELPIIRTQYL